MKRTDLQLIVSNAVQAADTLVRAKSSTLDKQLADQAAEQSEERKELLNGVAQIQQELLDRMSEVACESISRMEATQEDVVTRFGDIHHRLDAKTQELKDAFAEHKGDVDALRSQAEGFGKQIATLVDSVAAAHQAAQTVDGELSLALAEAEDRIKVEFGASLTGAESRLDDAVTLALEEARSRFTAVTESKRGELEESARKINEEFAVLAEGMSQAMLKAAAQQQDLRNEYEVWVKAMVNDAKSSVETTAQLLLEETRDARDQIVEDVFDTAKEYVESLTIPDPIPGEKGDPGARGEKGDPGRDGAVASVSKWQHNSYYSKDTAVSHFGGLWIATCNTDTEPGKSDAWINVVRGIEATSLDEHGALSLRMSDGQMLDVGNIRGPAGREWEHKGVYDADGWYIKGDVVILRGTSYVAAADSPGQCPGDGWKMLAQAQKGPAGKPGKQGKAGEKGTDGKDGLGFQWRGGYKQGETYEVNEVVRHANGVWIALQRNAEMPTPDGVNWDLMMRGES